MGYKAANTLVSKTSTSCKIRKKSTSSSSSNTTNSSTSPLYRKYRNIYHQLLRRHSTSYENQIINSLFLKTSFGTSIDINESRELALIDIDKLISLNLGDLKEKDERVRVMREVVWRERLERASEGF
jgi:hypothetical protein